MREIAKFTGAKVVGLNNNEYQVGRCQVFGERYGLENLTRAVKGNFEEMPFEDCSFDKAYAIGIGLVILEATCHAKALENPYGEIFRVLKPGGYFACYEWLTTPNYDPTDKTHKEIIHNLERGNGNRLDNLRNLPTPLLQGMSRCFEISRI
jgi:sterol 24-C-methyltransferase